MPDTIRKISVDEIKVGMFISRLDNSWLNSPLIMSDFKVESERDISNIRDYEIKHVFIDLSKGCGLDAPEETGEGARLSMSDMFEVDIDEFWADAPLPVDLYRVRGGSLDLALKSGMTLDVHSDSLIRTEGERTAMAPRSQMGELENYRRAREAAREKNRESGFAEGYLDPARVKEHMAFMGQYHPISPMSLVPGTVVMFDIFIRIDRIINLALEHGRRLEADMRDGWIERDVNILIRREEKESYQAYMQASRKDVKDPGVKAAMVRENSKIIVESLAENPRCEKLMGQTKDSVTDLIMTVIDNPDTFYAIMKINNYDYYTFTHSVNVATLSISLAMASGIKDEKRLSDLGVGAVLHDLGKSKVDPALINKPGSLSDAEFRLVREHVTLGYDMLKWNKALPADALIPVLQHHERLTGTGYPNRLKGERIHVYGRIVSVIDAYDALTTTRTYRGAIKTFDALALISKGLESYDAALFAMLVKIIHRQEA
ncbi:MAG: DUF3391 domain-containing protein [Nitrospinae bacterium]|nr:DUF3391 domain-containing protein [Nitrospinota bacterium]